jgi:hypothetical protein
MKESPSYVYYSDHFNMTEETLMNEYLTLNTNEKKTFSLFYDKQYTRIFYDDPVIEDK